MPKQMCFSVQKLILQLFIHDLFTQEGGLLIHDNSTHVFGIGS